MESLLTLLLISFIDNPSQCGVQKLNEIPGDRRLCFSHLDRQVSTRIELDLSERIINHLDRAARLCCRITDQPPQAPKMLVGFVLQHVPETLFETRQIVRLKPAQFPEKVLLPFHVRLEVTRSIRPAHQVEVHRVNQIATMFGEPNIELCKLILNTANELVAECIDVIGPDGAIDSLATFCQTSRNVFRDGLPISAITNPLKHFFRLLQMKLETAKLVAQRHDLLLNFVEGSFDTLQLCFQLSQLRVPISEFIHVALGFRKLLGRRRHIDILKTLGLQ